MKMHTRLLMAMLAGAIVTACSNPQASGTRIQVAPQREAPATRPASVPEIPLPLETPPKLETLMETTPTQGPESSSTAPTRRAAIPVGTPIAVLENHRGARSVKLWLKQDGSTLTGNILDPTTGDLRLHGNVTGQSVRFSTERGIQGGAERSEYSGTIWGSRLAGTVIVRTTPKPTGPKRVGMPQMSASERSYMWSARPVRE